MFPLCLLYTCSNVPFYQQWTKQQRRLNRETEPVKCVTGICYTWRLRKNNWKTIRKNIRNKQQTLNACIATKHFVSMSNTQFFFPTSVQKSHNMRKMPFNKLIIAWKRRAEPVLKTALCFRSRLMIKVVKSKMMTRDYTNQGDINNPWQSLKVFSASSVS